MSRFWPFRYLGLKVLSVALAVLLWMVVSGEETVERAMRVPLEFQQFPEGLELVGDSPLAVDVRMRGASGTLSRLGSGDVIAVIDLGGVPAGPRLFQLTPEIVRAPAGVEIIQVSPSTTRMVFARTASRTVPLTPPALTGTPAEGFLVGRVTVEPATVELVGPESAFDHDTHAIVEPVSVEGLQHATRESVAIGTTDPALRLKQPVSARVTIDIAPAVDRVLHALPVQMRDLGAGLTATVVQPVVVDVSLHGISDALASLQPDDVTVYVELNGLGAGQHVLPMHAISARGDVSRIEPSTIQVRINRVK